MQTFNEYLKGKDLKDAILYGRPRLYWGIKHGTELVYPFRSPSVRDEWISEDPVGRRRCITPDNHIQNNIRKGFIKYGRLPEHLA